MKFKRSLSLILCLMMLISVIPAQVFADDEGIEDEEIISFEEIIAADDFEEEPVDEAVPEDTLEDEEIIGDEEVIEDEEIPEDEEITEDEDEIPEEPEIDDEDAEEAEDEEDEDEEDEDDEDDEDEIGSIIPGVMHVNPVYEGIFNPYIPELPELDSEELNNTFDATYVDYSTAASQLAACMAARNSSQRLYVKVLRSNVTSGGVIDDDKFWLDIFNNVEAKAVKHTGNPTYGDYIMYQYGGIYYSGANIDNSDSTYFYVNFYCYPEYYTTASQEGAVSSKVNSIISSLGLNSGSLSTYDKICRIYNYLCQNISYDYAHLNNSSYLLQYTAYGALVQNTAVCQGIAVAFYRLCLASGVTGVRVVTSDPMCHAWNIVDPGVGKYYFVDATWDLWENGHSKDNYQWFLRGQNYYSRNHTVSGVSEMGEITPYTYYFIGEYVYTKATKANAQYLIDTKDFDASAFKPVVKITLPAPVLTLAANYADYIKVVWNPVSGAESYRLSYRIGNGEWVKFCDTISTAIKFTNAIDGATYTFKVECFSKDGRVQMSNESNRIGQMRLTTPKTTVNRFGGAGETGGFKVSWTATTGGSQYKIYYREKGSSTWALYTMIPKTANTTFCNIKASITNANPNLPNLVAGHSYEFMVLTCTTVASVTSGFPTSFTAYKY